MRVLLSPGESELASALRDGLTGHEAVVDVDPEIGAESGVRTVDAGFDAVVLAGLPDADGPADPSAVLDRATRLAYDLLNAAAESGVRRCVYLSSLRLLAGYGAHHTVTEGWRPLPPSGDPALIGCHLGEQIGEAQQTQLLAGMGQQADPNADRPDLRGNLVDAGADAPLVEHEGQREASDAPCQGAPGIPRGGARVKVLIVGGNGSMGPRAIAALQGRHELRVTDINAAPAGFAHEYRQLDAGDHDGVIDAAEGMDAIVNLSVLREDRVQAFEVNLQGNYNLAVAAVRPGIRRIVNTGPHYQVAGPSYDEFDFGLHPDMPPQPGTLLYALTKALGHEVLRVFSEQHDLYVQTLLFYLMRHPTKAGRLDDHEKGGVGRDMIPPYIVAWPDTGLAVRETYFVFPTIPHGKYRNDKLTRVLGWEPPHRLEHLWMRRMDR